MFPENAFKILRAHRFPAGGRLVSVSSDLSTPTCKDEYQLNIYIKVWMFFNGGGFNKFVIWANHFIQLLQEISLNYNWLYPICAISPDKARW